MFKNSRLESKKLKLMRSLNSRMILSSDDVQTYSNLKKGYEGEVIFDSLLKRDGLDNKFHILCDLNLESNNSKFQIDSFIITQETIIPCEVKNHQGNYNYKNNGFYNCSTDKQINNPLHQSDRSKILLGQLLHKHGFHLPIENYVIFINPEFLLYQAPLNNSIIFHPQLKKFLKSLGSKPANLNSFHSKLTDLLLKLNFNEHSYHGLPQYDYAKLRKGIFCLICQSFLLNIRKNKVVCTECGYEEDIFAAVIRNTEELRLLFPDMRITTNIVYDWCILGGNKKNIRMKLNKYYQIIGHGKYSYYTDK